MAEKKSLLNRQNSIWIFILLAVSGIAFFVRWRGIEYISADMRNCLIPWSEAMKPGYGPSILTTFDGDYNMPYVTILWLLNYLPGNTVTKVKLFSVLFDFLGAIAAGLIVVRVLKMSEPEDGLFGYKSLNGKYWKEISFISVYAAILFYPSVVINGGYWGQCDMVYVTFLLYMVYALLRDKPSVAMVLLGCAFSFKLQAVLILPVLIIYYWKCRRISWYHFLWIPITMELLCIPAIIGGHSALVPFSVYLRQLGRYPYMYVYYPNIWAIFKDAPYYIFGTVANVSIIAILGVFAVLVILRQNVETPKEWIRYIFWSVFFMMCFLPCMHERYGMLLEIVAIIYAFLDKRYGIYTIVIGIGSWIAYMYLGFLTFILPDEWTAIAYLLCLGFMTYQVVQDSIKNQQTVKEISGSRVCTWEERVIQFVNQHIYTIAFVLLTIFAIIIRKPMMECISADYLQYLIETDETRSTTLYMTLMWVLSIFHEKPLFFLLKLMCIAGDLLAAALVAYCVYRYIGKRGALVAYAVALCLPTTYLVSSIWGHVDSLAVAALASAWLAAERENLKGKYIWCGLLIGLAVALVSHYMIPALIWGWHIAMKRKKKQDVYTLIITAIATMFILSISGMLCGYTLGQCVTRLLTWDMGTSWVLYPLMLLMLCLCVKDIRWMLPTVVLQLMFVLNYGQFLYEQPIVPSVVLLIGGIIVLVLSVGVYKAQKNCKE